MHSHTPHRRARLDEIHLDLHTLLEDWRGRAGRHGLAAADLAPVRRALHRARRKMDGLPLRQRVPFLPETGRTGAVAVIAALEATLAACAEARALRPPMPASARPDGRHAVFPTRPAHRRAIRQSVSRSG